MHKWDKGKSWKWGVCDNMHDSILLIRFLNYYHLLSEEENRTFCILTW